MAEPTCDLLWLTGIAREMSTDFNGRALRLLRHNDRPFCWLDAGGKRSWIADMTPGASHMRRESPEDSENWRTWGGHRTDGAEVTSVGTAKGDRVLVVHARWRSRLGDDVASRFVFELGGRQTNAVIVDPGTNVVIDVLRPVSGRVNRVREVLPGRQYVSPPTFDRQRIDQPWHWRTDDDRSIKVYLTRGFLAMSAPWAVELLARADVDPATSVDRLSQKDRDSMESIAAEMLADPTPVILLDEHGQPLDHVGFAPTTISDDGHRPAGSFATATDLVREGRRAAEQQTARARAYREALRQRLRKLEKQRVNLLGDLERAQRAEELKRLADLIMAHLGQIPDGAAEADLTDFYDPDQKTVTVRLIPSVPPAQQADRLYRRSRKLRASTPVIQNRLARTEEKLHRLREREALSEEEIEAMLRKGTIDDASDDERGYQGIPGLRPRRYRTRDGGWLVLAGRNDRENDLLSLKVATSDDVWFHAHGCPGSHVVLKREGRPDMPSRAALGEAASLAAYWSKARGSSKVGVSYTLGKYVTKPKGASPGTVTIRHEKLLTVPPALLPLADSTEADHQQW